MSLFSDYYVHKEEYIDNYDPSEERCEECGEFMYNHDDGECPEQVYEP